MRVEENTSVVTVTVLYELRRMLNDACWAAGRWQLPLGYRISGSGKKARYRAFLRTVKRYFLAEGKVWVRFSPFEVRIRGLTAHEREAPSKDGKPRGIRENDKPTGLTSLLSR